MEGFKRCEAEEDGLYDPLAKRQPDRDFAGEGVDVEKGEHQFADEKRCQIGENSPLRDGEKDERYPEQYVDDSPFVCFLVPRDIVPALMSKGTTVGGMIQLSSNLTTGWSGKSAIIRRYMIALSDMEELLSSAQAVK